MLCMCMCVCVCEKERGRERETLHESFSESPYSAQMGLIKNLKPWFLSTFRIHIKSDTHTHVHTVIHTHTHVHTHINAHTFPPSLSSSYFCLLLPTSVCSPSFLSLSLSLSLCLTPLNTNSDWLKVILPNTVEVNRNNIGHLGLPHRFTPHCSL